MWGMLRIFVSLVFSLALAAMAGAAEWTNLDPEKRLGGRLVSAGYLRGKVVLLDCRNYGEKQNFEAIRKLQEVWTSYKTKPFVVIGSHRGEQSAKLMAAILERLGVTYPVYDGAMIEELKETDKPTAYVIDATGRCVYAGNIRSASAVVASSILTAASPTSVRQWRDLLSFEIDNLPGQALLRLKDLQTKPVVRSELAAKYPEDLARFDAAYERLKGDAEVRKLAKLVEISRLVKDRDTAAAKKLTRASVENQMEKFAALKDSENALVVQEAKNALVELKIVAASLDK